MTDANEELDRVLGGEDHPAESQGRRSTGPRTEATRLREEAELLERMRHDPKVSVRKYAARACGADWEAFSRVLRDHDFSGASRVALVREIRGRLFEAAWRRDDREWLDPKIVSRILDEVEGAAPRAEGRPATEPRTKAGQEMESWLREPEDYEWGRKVTDAILAIEAEAAQGAAHAEWWYAVGRCAERHATLPKIEQPCSDCLATAHDVVPPDHFVASRAEGLPLEPDVTWRGTEEYDRLRADDHEPCDRCYERGWKAGEKGTAREVCKRFRHDEHCIDEPHA